MLIRITSSLDEDDTELLGKETPKIFTSYHNLHKERLCQTMSFFTSEKNKESGALYPHILLKIK